MLFTTLLGFALGFVSAIPVAGPISALIFSKAMSGRTRDVKGIAVGASVAEGIYALLAFWGFGTFLSHYEFVIPISKAVGSLILLTLGTIFVVKPRVVTETDLGQKRGQRRKGFVLGFLLTGLNPTLIATWSAAIATLFSIEAIEYSWDGAVLFSIGVAAGITLWFLILLRIVKTQRGRFASKTLERIQRGLGVLLLAIGCWFALQALGSFIS